MYHAKKLIHFPDINVKNCMNVCIAWHCPAGGALNGILIRGLKGLDVAHLTQRWRLSGVLRNYTALDFMQSVKIQH